MNCFARHVRKCGERAGRQSARRQATTFAHEPQQQRITDTSAMNESPADTIKRRQREWAERIGQTLNDKGYCGCDDDNIHGGLSESARCEFGEGGGQELGGKIRAAHSSSALACNWFDYWRDRDFGVLSDAFGVPSPFVSLRLEAKLPTGMRGADATLDVMLTAADGSLFGIESKFAEPYTSSPAKTRLKPQYFSQNRAMWADVGLSGCPGDCRTASNGNSGFRRTRRRATAQAHAGAREDGQPLDSVLSLVRRSRKGCRSTPNRTSAVHGGARFRRAAFHHGDLSGVVRAHGAAGSIRAR